MLTKKTPFPSFVRLIHLTLYLALPGTMLLATGDDPSSELKKRIENLRVEEQELDQEIHLLYEEIGRLQIQLDELGILRREGSREIQRLQNEYRSQLLENEGQGEMARLLRIQSSLESELARLNQERLQRQFESKRIITNLELERNRLRIERPKSRETSSEKDMTEPQDFYRNSLQIDLDLLKANRNKDIQELDIYRRSRFIQRELFRVRMDVGSSERSRRRCRENSKGS